MTTTHGIDDLGQKIERLVEEHLAASRAAAAAAVQRAFGVTRQAPAKARRPAKAEKNAKRRTQAELAELADRLHEAVCSSPGESMDVLAAKVGASPRELHRSMSLLKRAGRLRSAGQRNHTRYFPTASAARAPA